MPSVPLLFIIPLLLTQSLQSWSPNSHQNAYYSYLQSLPGASCRIDTTICKQPKNVTDFNYDGILRTGYLSIDGKSGSALGFMFWGKKGVTDVNLLRNFPTFVVLGGGPGMSSQFSNLREIGPFLLKKIFSISVVQNKNTWAREANLLFIDQPVGTGVSCLASATHIPSSMSSVVDDFIRAFNKIFLSDQSTLNNGCFSPANLNIPPSSPFYFFGQGYAGKFVSAIAARIISQKKAGRSQIGLKGIGIGNGFNVPFRIMSELGSFGFSMGLLDYQERMKIEKIILRSSFDFQRKNWTSLKTGFERAIGFLKDRSGVNYYDISKDSFDQDILQYYFSNSENLKKFSFQTSISFQTNSPQVYSRLGSEFMQNQLSSLQYILSSSIPVLLFQGQNDAYSNTAGSLKWIEQLNYPSSAQFRNKNLQAWKNNGVMHGSRKGAGLVSLYVLHDRGHYANFQGDQGGYDMIRAWLKAVNV